MKQLVPDAIRRSLNRLATRWEEASAAQLDARLRSSLVLEPAAYTLAAWTRSKRSLARLKSAGWTFVGLPSRFEQLRLLHALNELESKLLDIEERLQDQEERR